MSKIVKVIVLGVSALLLVLPAYAQEAAGEKTRPSQAEQAAVADQGRELPAKEQLKGLDEQVQEIKSEVLGIAAELNRLEEKLLYPSGTQIAIFVSLDGGESFRLDAVDVALDGKPVAHHLYTFKELEALQRGGVQRIYVGNVKAGEHPLQVTVSGKSEGGSEFRKGESFTISKGTGPKLVGIVLAGGKTITLKDW